MSEVDKFLDEYEKNQRQGQAGAGQQRPRTEVDDLVDAAPNTRVGLGRSIADTGVGLAASLLSGAQMLTNVAGADNAASRALGSASDYVRGFESAGRREERAARARKIEEAEQSGSTWREIGAHLGAFAEAPIDTTIEAIGTSAPTLLVAALTRGRGGSAAPATVGAAQGAGAVKGSIYERVEQEYLKAGASPEEAAARAAEAQSYSGENDGQIALGAGLGALAGSTGIESAASRLLGREAGEAATQGVMKTAGMRAAAEAPMEAAQGGQERLAGNIAVRNEGFDTPLWQGVAGSAALEGVAGGAAGGGFGAVEGFMNRQPAVDPLADRSADDPMAGAGEPEPEVPPAGPGMAPGPVPEQYRRETLGAAPVQPAVETPVTEPTRAPTPSEQMGINPNAGPLSAAAAIAVDSGATDQLAQQTALQQVAEAAEQAQKRGGKQDQARVPESVDPQTGEVLQQGSLLDGDPVVQMQSRLDYLQQQARRTGWSKQLRRERDQIQARLQELGVQPGTREQVQSHAAVSAAKAGTQEPLPEDSKKGQRQVSIAPPVQISEDAPPSKERNRDERIRKLQDQGFEVANEAYNTYEGAVGRARQLNSARDGHAYFVRQAGFGTSDGGDYIVLRTPAEGGFKQGSEVDKFEEGQRWMTPSGQIITVSRAEDSSKPGMSRDAFRGRQRGTFKINGRDETYLLTAMDNYLLLGSDTKQSAGAGDAVAQESQAAAEQPAFDIKAITSKQIPQMTDAEIEQAINHYGPDHKRTAKLLKEQQKRAQQTTQRQEAATRAQETPEAQQAGSQRTEAAGEAAARAAVAQPAVQDDAAGAGARWESLSPEEKARILTQRGGWATAKGGLNVIGKRLAKSDWASIPPETRETVARLMDKAGLTVPAGEKAPQVTDPGNDIADGTPVVTINKRTGQSVDIGIYRGTDARTGSARIEVAPGEIIFRHPDVYEIRPISGDGRSQAPAEKSEPTVKAKRGRSGAAALKKLAEVAGLPLDDTGNRDTADMIAFFDRFYEAGRDGRDMPRADIHPQDARAAYEAGRKDREAASKAPKDPQAEQPATQTQAAAKAAPETQVQAQTKQPGRHVLRTYKTKSGKIGAQITETIRRDGKITYSYTGEWGAGSGIDPITMANTEDGWRRSKRGYTVEEAAQAAQADAPAAVSADAHRQDAQNSARAVAPEQVPADERAAVEQVLDSQQAGDDLLKMFLTPPSEPAPVQEKKAEEPKLTEQQKVDLEHIDHMISKRQKLIEDLKGRKYADNNSKVTVGDPDELLGEFAGSKTLSIGEINERRRDKNIRSLRDDIKDLEKLKGKVERGERSLGDLVEYYREHGLEEVAWEYDPRSSRMEVTASGKPFSSRQSAERAMRNRRLTGYQPVEIEGGWALERTSSESHADAPTVQEVEREQTAQPSTQEASQAAAAPETETKAKDAERFANNKLFTADKVAAARERMRKKLGQLNSGIDPELLVDGMTIAGAYIESGVRNFAQYAKAMIEDFGEGVKPYLLSFWEGARNYPGLDTKDMTSPDESRRQFEALVTPEQGKAIAPEAVGEVSKKPKKRTRKTGVRGDMVLTQDWGVEHIDGYSTSPDRETGNDTKDAFLKETRNYLNAVADSLRAFGYEPHMDRKGKPERPVSVNESGIYGSGDVTLTMHNPETGNNVYIHIGDSTLRGVVPTTPSGITVMYRVGAGTDRYATKAGNSWAPVDLSANELAQLINSRAQPARSEARDEQPADGATDQGGAQEVRSGRSAAQPGSAPADTGNVAARQPSDGEASGEAEDSGRPGVRKSGADVAPSEGASAGRAAGDGRARAGRARVSAAGAGDAGSTSRDTTPVTSPAATSAQAQDLHIDNPLDIVGGTPVQRFNRNRAALELLQQLEEEGRQATPEEQKILAGYIGWGSFGQELFQGTWERPVYKDEGVWKERGEWLRETLGESAWKSAQRSITNAHYTDPPTVMAMWDMVRRMGFKGGKVLEPAMGTGNFFSMMPADLKARSQLTGIELDETTGAIAKHLFPKSNVRIMGYQDSKTPDNFYDLVIGNWPFENTPVADRRYNKLNPMLHDYFFLKALDQVRPGGIVIGITSAGSMDKQNTMIRREMARKAELVASIRLPSGAFEEYAGTKVVTDIVILRKRPERLVAVPSDATWVETGEFQTPSGQKVRVNQYYLDNPHHVIGTMDYGHGTTTFRAGMIVHRPENMAERLRQAVELVPENAMRPAAQVDHLTYYANETGERHGALAVVNDQLMIAMGDQLVMASDRLKYELKDPKKTAIREQQLRAVVELRKLHSALVDAERRGDGAEAARRALKQGYERFVADHGKLRDSFALSYLERIDDPFFAELAALENDDGTPAAVMSRSTTRGRRKIDNPSIRDAYVLARNQAISPSLEDIARIAGKPAEEVKEELLQSGAVFESPAGDIVPSDIYLSGNVRQKLREAQAALEEGNASMQRNIDALQEVVPEDIPYFNIETKLGATWVPTDVYAQYIAHMLGRSDTKGIEVTFRAGRWKVRLDHSLNAAPEAKANYGTPHYGFSRLVQAALSNQTLRLRYKDEKGNEHYDAERSEEVNSRVAKMREDFATWLWSDPERRVDLEREYNESRNAWATPKYDGSFLTFEGMALTLGEGEFNLRQHQANAIWRAIVNRRSINAHEVGTGKTFTMGGIAVESRRYGIAKKPLILAHNANSATVAKEIRMMYPAARVLYVDNLDPKNRDIRLRQIANDDWDAIVIPHSLIDRLALREETLMQMAADDIAALEAEFYDAAAEDGISTANIDLDDDESIGKIRSVTAKELAKARKRIIENIKKQAQQSSREGAVSFEDLGIDMILVDEVHEFKKPPIVTRMQMKGLNTQVSARSVALQFLTRYVRQMNNGGNVHTFTGTPITNTITEIYHQMRYVMEAEMEQANVADWDGWFGSFATEVQDVELSAAGDYEMVTRLAGFVNVPELRQMVGQYMDTVFAEDMPEMQPRKINGKQLGDDMTEAEKAELLNGRTEGAKDRPYKKVINESSDMTAEQQRIFRELQRYAQDWRNATGKQRREWMRKGDPRSPIRTEGIANQASFDVRMLDESLAGMEGKTNDDPNSKASRAVANVLEIYNSHPHANQVIFAEQGFSKSVQRSVGAPGEKTRVNVKVFSTVHDIVERLVQGGIPRAEIAIVDGNTSKEKRREIAEAMNESRIRVVIGSTSTLGVGVNMQRNLRAMHHLDAPYMPGDLEQRNGRGQRQGNQWNTVLEYRYMTDRLDGRRWQILAVKQRFINAFMKANSSTRVIEGEAAADEQSDILESFSEAAGDPRVLQRVKLQKKVESLQRKERLYTQGIADMRRQIRYSTQEVERLDRSIKEADVEAVQNLLQAQRDSFTATINGTTFDNRADAVAALEDYLNNEIRVGEKERHIGTYGGHPLLVEWLGLHDAPTTRVRMGAMVFEGKGIAGMEANMRNLPKRVERLKAERDAAQAAITNMQQAMGQPFGQAEDLERAVKQLEDLEADLAANPVPPPAWLRQGAPIDSEVFRNKRPYVVTGHRYSEDGWFVLAEDAKGATVIPYMEVTDAAGMPIYEEREFEKPVVVTKSDSKELTEADRVTDQPKFSRSGRQSSGGQSASLPASIEVDGIQRPTTNSKGQLIHPTGERVLDQAEDLEQQGFTEAAYAGTNGAPADRIYGFRERMPGGENYFGGIFASAERDIAGSHGETIQEFRYKPEAFLSHDDLRYELFYGENSKEWVAALESAVKEKLHETLTEEELADLAEFVVGDKSVFSDEFVTGEERLSDILGYGEQQEMDWALQGLAGELARRMGYSVIAMPDEHGTSLLILGGDGVRFVNDKAEYNQQPFGGPEEARTLLPEGTTEIDVDGVQRPALNSAGRPIHPTVEGVRNFWRWFGDSKVVDAQGRPLVVYHGSPDLRFVNEDGVFRSQNERFGMGSTDAAHWFASSEATAKSYADPRRAFDYQNAEEGVLAAYIKIENPLIVDGAGGNWYDVQRRGNASDVIEEARANGHDGVIIRNVKDDYNNSASTRPTDTYVVFNSTQIKSATDNVGTFDPANPDIRRSFAGRRALTSQPMALKTAQLRIAGGEDPEVVRMETGWHRGNDGKWRFEISDDQASLAVPGQTFGDIHAYAYANAYADGRKQVTVADILHHDQLFAAYPALAEIPVSLMGEGERASARLQRRATGMAIQVQPGMRRSLVVSALLHELQHGIQTIEGFARGGSAKNLVSEYDRTGAKTYRRLAGEVEARNTQTRQGMTAAMRRRIAPEMTADVPASDVIVTFNGRDMIHGPLPGNAQTRPAMTQGQILRAFQAKFPKLVPAVRTMLSRGTEGKRGGLVLVDSADPLMIARAFSKKTGRPLTDTIQLFSEAGIIHGFYDPQSGLTFLITPNLDAVTAPAVLLHEMVHGQQRRRIDERATEMLMNRSKFKDPELRAFLDRVAQRMIDAGESTNMEEAAPYIVEQAVIEGRSQGYALADSRFLSWVDKTIGQRVGDLIRSMLASIRSWMLRNGMKPGEITVDDLVGYAMAGVERAARGRVDGGDVAFSRDAITNTPGTLVSVDDLSAHEKEDLVTALDAGRSESFTQAIEGEVFTDEDIRQNIFGLVDPLMVRRLSVPLNSLSSDATTSKTAVARYAEMRSRAPAILVRRDGDGWRVVEGHHRYAAAVERGDANIDAIDITEFLDMDWRSYLDGESLPGMPLRGQQNNPDIRFSRSGVKQLASRATLELNRTFNAPGKLHWWHKTVGTMYNLAERSPAFKPVFEAAQGFIDDVAHYAADAAELAPKLLPRLETWRDILRRPISADDNKAISAPIFEGTLVWARDGSGRPVRVDDLEAAAARMTTEQKVQALLDADKIPAGMLKAWQALPEDQFAKMIDSRYESQLLKAGIVWTDDELRSMFKLNDEQVALYREFRAATDRSLDTMARADMLRFAGNDAKDLRDAVMDAADVHEAARLLVNHLQELSQAMPDRETHLMQLAHGIMERAERVRELQAEGYAPLSRFGKYTVDVVVDGERQYFGLFETRREANKMAEAMRAEFGDMAVSQGTLSNESFKLFAGVTPETLELFGNMLGLDSTGDSAQDQAFQQYLRLTKSNRSAMRRLIHRKGIAGYSEDVGRVLASFIYSNARQTAAGLNIGQLGEAVNQIPKEQGELKDAAIRLSEYIKNPQEEAQAMRGLLFAQYLGGSVASAFVNLTQPVQVTFPWLSQYAGARGAAKEISRAVKQMSTRGHKYEPDLAQALKEAENDGTVSPQEVHQLMAQARGSGSLRAGDGTRVGEARAFTSNQIARLSLAWGKMFGAAEQVNRRITFIAAYRVARDKGMPDPAAFARRAVQETQFVYSKASKMQWGRGAIGGTLMTFKTYTVSYIELMHRLWNQGEPGSEERREGRKAAMLMVATLMLMGGVGGLPFAEDLEDLIDGAAQLMGYNFSSRQAKEQFLRDVFGDAMGEFIEKGVSGLPGAPMDVSGRLGMGNLIPGTGLFTERTSHARDVLEILGPGGDFANRILSGGRQILGGDVGAGLLEMSPVAVRNVAKGADMAVHGMYRDTKGYKVLDTDILDAALKAAGFQPAGVARIQEANWINQRAKNFYNMKAQEIRALWAAGIFEGDQAKVQRARDRVAEWNRKNPDQPMIIRIPDVMRRVREMRKTKDQRIAATAPRAMRAQMREDLARVRSEL